MQMVDLGEAALPSWQAQCNKAGLRINKDGNDIEGSIRLL